MKHKTWNIYEIHNEEGSRYADEEEVRHILMGNYRDIDLAMDSLHEMGALKVPGRMIRVPQDLHWYAFRNRPPSIGTHPAGAVGYSIRPGEMEISPHLGSRPIRGRVAYKKPLSWDDIYRYELLPLDRAECARYLLASAHEFDEKVLEELIEDYWEGAGSIEMMKQWAERGEYVPSLLLELREDEDGRSD